ncbi:MAG TPA: GNAT family N-acetyltransferase [Micromonosporaceae bacterium]|nr:GNAT family N-acetyltransferase [Micromonosporaceae bacterium]
MKADPLLEAYERLRVFVPTQLPPRWTVERDGPVVRLIEPNGMGHVCYTAFGELSDGVPDELILRERELFAERGAPVEWMLHGHDLPADLPDRLRAFGFTPTVDGTVMVEKVGEIARLDPTPAPGIQLREVTEKEDFKRIAALYNDVWGFDHTMTMAGLRREQRDLPDAITIVAAQTTEGEIVSAGWVRFVPGSGFAMLWGGSTAAAWRGRGIYRALVAYRARLAERRGYDHVQVTASQESRPILDRLGMVAVTTAMPHLWTPEKGDQ